MTKTKKLGEVFDIRKGKKAAATSDTFVPGSHPYIQIDEVRGVTPTKFAIDPKPVVVNGNDLCIVWDGANAGTVGYGVTGAIGSTVSRLRLKEPDRWDPRFLGRLLDGLFPKLNKEAQSRGATIPHVDKAKLEEIDFPLIEPTEQRRIAAILDKADAIRRKREHALALADDFLRSVFLEMFGRPGQPNPLLPTEELGQICDLFAGNSLPVGTTFDGQEHGLLLLKVGDMNLSGNEEIVQVAREWIDEDQVTGPAIRAPKDAIVFPKRGGAIATNKKRVLGRDCILDPNLMAVAPKVASPISYQFLRVWFDLLDLSTLSNGSTVPQLNKGDLKPLELPLPRPNDLIAFDRVFGNVTRVRQRLAVDLGMSETLFAALSQRAFAGDL